MLGMASAEACHPWGMGATQAAKLQQKVEFERRKKAGQEVTALEAALQASQDRLAELIQVCTPSLGPVFVKPQATLA